MKRLSAGLTTFALMVAPSLAAPPGSVVDTPKIGIIQIDATPRERPAELAWLLGGGEPTLRELTQQIVDAAGDGTIGTLVIRVKDADLNRTQAEELGAAMRAAREKGKRVDLFCENYGPTEVVLGSFADHAYIQSGGEVSLPGMHMEELFLADTLSWIGVKADLVQIGEYKGANEMFVNAAPSKAWDQNINQLLDSLYGTMRTQLKMGRRLTDEKLDLAMKAAWMADAEEAVSAGLIDAPVDLPSLGQTITGAKEQEWVDLMADEDKTPKLDASNPFVAASEVMGLLSKKPPTRPTGPTIAVLHIDGEIVDGDSSRGGLLGGESVGSRTIRNALEDILDEDQVKGMVVRIDSPGGSAVASEVIWEGVRRVAAKKPVWVSVGSMAASGGYYIAVAGDRIYVNPSSIVGSIGVVGGKFSMGGLLEKLKVHVTERNRGPMASMQNMTEPWSPEQLAQVRVKMTKTFDLFKSRVAAGRKGIDLSKTAGGWLFSGQKAIDMKMADKLGGLDTTIADLAGDLKLSEYDVMDYPGPRPLGEVIQDMLKGFVESPGVRAPGGSAVASELAGVLKEAVGPRAWPEVRASMGAVLQLRREPVVLVMPRAIVVK